MKPDFTVPSWFAAWRGLLAACGAAHRVGGLAQTAARQSPMGLARCLAIGLLALLWWSAGTSGAAIATAQGPTITNVAIGLGGKFKVGHWTPVHVTVDGGESDFAGQYRADVAGQ